MTNIYHVSGTFRELARQIERERKRKRLRLIGLAVATLALLAIYGYWTAQLTQECETRGYSHEYCVKLVD